MYIKKNRPSIKSFPGENLKEPYMIDDKKLQKYSYKGKLRVSVN